MPATDELKHEHRVIEQMLAVLSAAVTKVGERQSLPEDFFPKVVDFCRNFLDRCHHGKEEEHLFPALEARGIPREGGPIGVMLMEHEQGRAHVRAIDGAAQRLASGDTGALKVAMDNARAFVSLLTQHIYKEDNILFVMADRVLSPADQQELAAKFEQVERERIGLGKHHEYVKLIESLEREIGNT